MEASIVLITSTSPIIEEFGTGFIIHRDEEAVYALTCAHVVERLGGPEQIKAGNYPAKVVALGSADGADDLAVLRIEGLLDLPSLSLGVSGNKGQSVIITGFSRQPGSKAFTLKSLAGELGDPVRLESRKKPGRIRAWEVEIKEDALKPGFSGSPLTDASTRVVLGLVIELIGEGKKGTAISVDALDNIWPDIAPTLMKRQDDAQESNPDPTAEAIPFPLRPYPRQKAKNTKSRTNHTFHLRQTVYTASSKAGIIEQYLGGGAEAEMYRVNLEGKTVALKWYRTYQIHQDSSLRSRIGMLTSLQAPSDRFAWPMELAVSSKPEVSGFGVVMPFLESRYKSLLDLMRRQVEPSFRTLATTAFELAQGYHELHKRRLCFHDISFRNLFFDPNTGNIKFYDLDGVDAIQSSGPSGTQRFMAPELVRGEALPSIHTDLFTLAITLFYIFMIHHPLEGMKEFAIDALDLPAMRKLYGEEPVFIFDPTNNSNRPEPIYHDNALVFWPIYPGFLQKSFIKVFTEGIHDPRYGRLSTTEWQEVLVRLRDSIFYCNLCGVENFYDPDLVQLSSKESGNVCWSCGKAPQLPPRLHIGRNTVMLNYDTQLFPYHSLDEATYDFSEPVGEMVQFSTVPSVLGLKNLSKERWQITAADGETQVVLPGQSIALGNGTKVNFGRSEGEFRL